MSAVMALHLVTCLGLRGMCLELCEPAKMDDACSDGIAPCCEPHLATTDLCACPGQHANKAMLLCRIVVLCQTQLHLEMLSMIRHEACTCHMEALGVGYFLLTNVIV